MSQHDYELSDQAGAAFRSDLNLALLAIRNNNSGSSFSVTPAPYQFWAYTTGDGTLRIRNAADNAWIDLHNLTTGACPANALLAGSSTQDFAVQKLTASKGINEARGSIAMHATTMDLWAQPNIIDATSGGVVTITAIVNAPQAGARRVLYPTTSSVLTNGATFAIDGGENVTAAAGDSWEFEAITTSTYKVHVTKNVASVGLSDDQTWTGAQRGTITTDNDLSFDLNASNNFFCTPTAGGALTFANHVSGQSGFVKLVNSSNYAITAAGTTKCDSSFLSIISTTGTYLISYLDDGTNTYCVTSGALA